MKLFSSRGEKRRYYRQLRISAYCVIGIVALFGIGTLYGLLNISFLKIKTFEVSGIAKLEDIQPKVLTSWIAQIFGLHNFLSWPGNVGGIAVEKHYSEGKLVLVGQTADRFAIWCTSGASAQAPICFWVNREGTALEQAPDTEGGTIAKIQDSRDFQPATGAPVLPETQFSAVTGILDGLATVPISIKSYTFDNRLEEIVATPTHGGKLIFGVRFVPNDKLFSSLNNLVSTGQLKNAEYADFTVENRIYLK